MAGAFKQFCESLTRAVGILLGLLTGAIRPSAPPTTTCGPVGDRAVGDLVVRCGDGSAAR